MARRAVLVGIGLATAGYACFSLQDAFTKLLVVRLAVPEILFVRSLVVLGLALAAGRARRADVPAPWHFRRPGLLLLRACLILVGWITFYTAARSLQLAEMTTLYFAAPLFVVVLSVAVLGERPGPARWTAVLVGFGGVLIAAQPSGGMAPGPAALALTAALAWGASTIVSRLIARTESTAAQLVASNAVFAVATALMLPWLWVTPTPHEAVLLAGVGLVGGAGQYLLFDSYRHAPASVLAPIEYIGLVWAFALGALIFAQVPGPSVWLGAAVIVAASLMLVWAESRPAAGGPDTLGP